MTQYLIPKGAIEDGLDRQNLSILRRRFMAVNANRLMRMRTALAERHKAFLDALPILFHCNHPMMPGFVSRSTPSKVSDFKPEKKDVLAAKQLARSFTLHFNPELSDSIYGIYVMGSVGSIAQSGGSDLDIWLCYRPGLDQRALDELGKKCQGIQDWAAAQRLEIYIFLMDYEEFKQGKLSSLNEESSGSAQRLLLLDEFYRSAIFLAGRIPLWWFVPSKQEPDYEDYANTLLHKRFVSEQSVLDFGPVANIPAGEFIGASVWQLYKAIESPYKSVLKLLLLEAYVSDFPNIQPLSMSFKQLVFDGEMNIDKLDSYVMVYQRIEDYLLSNQQLKRLELARRCFYFKVKKPLSKAPRTGRKSWQREVLEELVSDWGWTLSDLEYLDKRNEWKVSQVTGERVQLVNELNHSYRFLTDFANQVGAERAISADELKILGRKLQAAFERRPGKIEWINPGISKDVSEELVSLHYERPHQQSPSTWHCYAHAAGSTIALSEGQHLKSASNVVELLLWAYFNRVISSHTHIEAQDAPNIENSELRKIFSLFNQWLPLPMPQLAHNSFQKTASPSKALLMLNVASRDSDELNSLGLQRLSGKSDALRYSGFEENLVTSADVLVCNSWNEINTRRFEGPQALVDAMLEYLQLCVPGTHQQPPKLEIHCVANEHATTITHRVREWFDEIIECFYKASRPSARFIFQLSRDFYSLQFIGLKPQLRQFNSDDQLLHSLEEEQKKYSPIVIDREALRDHALPLMIKHCRSGAISVFYRQFDIGLELYVIDELGSITYSVYRGRKDHNPLKPLHHFLRSVLSRQTLTNADMLGEFGIYPVHFYEIHKSARSGYSLNKKQISPDLSRASLFEVKAIAHKNNSDKVCYDFYCDDQEFSAHSFGDQLYLVVAQFILGRRQQQSNYPLYISDLDLSLCREQLSKTGRLQTCHYLQEKNRLESQLNRAIGILLNA